MIICKIYLDSMNGADCLVAELAKRNVSQNNTNLNEGELLSDDPRAVYVYPTIVVAMSLEAKNALVSKFQRENRRKNIFLADFTLEMDDYENKVGCLGFRPVLAEGGNQRKKIMPLNRLMYVDSRKMWVEILDSAMIFDNELLKNLDLSEPVDEKTLL